LAATLAWVIATEVMDHQRPFFAPLSALICVGTGHGKRTRRAIELVIGVALGIAVADLVVRAIGSGIWQLALVTMLAMAVAVLLGSGPVLVSQAAVSAMLVVTVQPPGSGLSGPRFVDALTGGAVALVITSLFPADPLRAVKSAAGTVLEELEAVLVDLADALDLRSAERVWAALDRARAIDAEGRWLEAVEVGQEIARTAPPRRGAKGELELHAHAAEQVDLAVRNVRVLARAILRAVELDDPVPSALHEALEHLASAVSGLGMHLADPDLQTRARASALQAVACASRAVDEEPSLSVSVIVGQIRSTATDLLGGLGDEDSDARSAVRAAVLKAKR
jgi:uncharacterized membrane protein YgaE (UPF0421/DUF939 family)